MSKRHRGWLAGDITQAAKKTAYHALSQAWGPSSFSPGLHSPAPFGGDTIELWKMCTRGTFCPRNLSAPVSRASPGYLIVNIANPDLSLSHQAPREQVKSLPCPVGQAVHSLLSPSSLASLPGLCSHPALPPPSQRPEYRRRNTAGDPGPSEDKSPVWNRFPAHSETWRREDGARDGEGRSSHFFVPVKICVNSALSSRGPAANCILGRKKKLIRLSDWCPAMAKNCNAEVAAVSISGGLFVSAEDGELLIHLQCSSANL